MRGQLVAAARVLVVLTVLVGVACPLLMTGVAQLAFDEEADGSLVRRDGVDFLLDDVASRADAYRGRNGLPAMCPCPWTP